MFVYVTIIRNNETLYLVSPGYGVFELSNKRTTMLYLWESALSAERDSRWNHLLLPNDEIEYRRSYS